MKDWTEYFKGKKITVAGLGLLGRGVGDAVFLAKNGAELIVTDLKSGDALHESVQKLEEYPNVTFVLGEHREEDFTNRDFILKGPTVPQDSPYIERARQEEIPIKMSASWFVELTNIPTVGVTGTRGKSTVTHMLNDIMTASGMRVLLGGNVPGVSTLSLLAKVTPESIALLELDSWQCWGFGEAGLSPNVSVFTSFMHDHLDYYRGNADAYLNDKAQIFLSQDASDTLVIAAQAHDTITSQYGKKIRSNVALADPKRFPNGWTLRIPGRHNVANATCALEAARALGIDDAVSKKALEAFGGVPGRLERLRETDGVLFYNDTTATTPEATIAALQALDNGSHNLVLIMGGNDKGLATDALLEAVPKHTKHVALLDGTGTRNIASKLSGATVYRTLLEAFEDAVSHAQAGDVVLLSPAFTSFGMFKNEFDRGAQFVSLVEAL